MPIPLGVLAVAGAGAGPVAAGNAYELLETQLLTGNQASVSFSNLNSTYGSTYQHLQLRMALRSSRGAAADSADITFNGTTSTYRWHALRGSGSAVESFGGSNSYAQLGLIPGNTNTANNFGGMVVDILDPFESTKNTTTRAFWGMVGSGENFVGLYSGAWFTTDALTSILIDCTNANFLTGSRFSLYGMRSS
jgi:hypothetical protein